MTFNPNIPNPTDLLSNSQPVLKTNNQALDNIFGIDHYKYSDLTVNKGFHNKVTTPIFVDSPPTGLPPVTTTNPVFYAFQQASNLGVLQFSRGPNNSVPTPVTTLQSTSAAIVLASSATTNVLDFNSAGLTIAYGFINAISDASSGGGGSTYIKWINNTLTIIGPQMSGITVQKSGTILQLMNPTSGTINVYWTLQFERIQ